MSLTMDFARASQRRAPKDFAPQDFFKPAGLFR